MENKKTRESNIELLRIITMCLLIIGHFGCHNIKPANYLTGTILRIISAQGNALFMIISGYFLIEKNLKSTKVVKLWLQTIFYSIIIMLAEYYIFHKTLDMIDIIKNLMPISSGEYWFISAYFFIYLFSPFINKIIKALNKKELKTLLIAIAILSILPNVLNYGKFVNAYIGSAGILLYFYSIGAYIKLYKIDILEKISTSKCLLIFLSLYVLTFIIANLSVYATFEFIYSYIVDNFSITAIATAIVIFYTFKKMKMNTNGVVNYISSCCLATYLIHENPFCRDLLWRKIFIMDNQTIINIQYMFLAVIIIYTIAIITETVRRNIFEKSIMKVKIINNICEKVDKLFEVS